LEAFDRLEHWSLKAFQSLSGILKVDSWQAADAAKEAAPPLGKVTGISRIGLGNLKSSVLCEVQSPIKMGCSPHGGMKRLASSCVNP
jgi:hypothetical protein